MENAVVIGSNYGDESKGRTTDYLVKQNSCHLQRY